MSRNLVLVSTGSSCSFSNLQVNRTEVVLVLVVVTHQHLCVLGRKVPVDAVTTRTVGDRKQWR